MTATKLKGVIAAIATAIDACGAPDCVRSVALARFLLANGCDGLNVLGTTGEATSFSTEQRMRVMSAYHAADLPMDRLMVGTGAAALADAIALTRHAAELGFAGALLLPPSTIKACPMMGSLPTSRPSWAPRRQIRSRSISTIFLRNPASRGTSGSSSDC